jgi:hypothetical protein
MPSQLPIEDDLTYHRRWWRMERVVLVGMLFLLAAGLAGMFGRGPLSRATASNGGTLSCEYERFARQFAPTELRCDILDSQMGTLLELRVGRAYYDSVRVDQIAPTPEEEEVTADHVAYRFKVNSRQPWRVTFFITPQRPGSLPVSLRHCDDALNFRQRVFP